MLILASNSPRRRELLDMAGWSYTVQPASIDEQPLPAEEPLAYVLRLAESKACAILESLSKPTPEDTFVIAADTTVIFAGEILGKPQDAAEAHAMLVRLRGRRHQVITGLALVHAGHRRCHTAVVATDVIMRDYSEEELSAYVASGDPLDKAGAYAIQHGGFHPVARLEGCFANVMGLPICQLGRILRAFGLTPDRPPRADCSGPAGGGCVFNEKFLLAEAR